MLNKKERKAADFLTSTSSSREAGITGKMLRDIVRNRLAEEHAAEQAAQNMTEENKEESPEFKDILESLAGEDFIVHSESYTSSDSDSDSDADYEDE